MKRPSSDGTYTLAVACLRGVCLTFMCHNFSEIYMSFKCIMALVNTKIGSRVLGKMPPWDWKTLAMYFGRVLVCLPSKGSCIDIDMCNSIKPVGFEYFLFYVQGD